MEKFEAMLQAAVDKLDAKIDALGNRLEKSFQKSLAQHEKRIEIVEHDILEIKGDVDQMKKDAETSEEKLEGGRANVNRLQDLVKEQKTEINELHSKLDSLEQYSRRNSIRVSGPMNLALPLTTESVIKLLNENINLNTPVDATEIDRAHLIGPKESENRPLLIKFATYASKARVLREKKQLYGGGPGGLFISEDLTKVRVELLYHCRQAKKKKAIHGCWTYDGNVLVEARDKIFRIQCLKDLDKAISTHSATD